MADPEAKVPLSEEAGVKDRKKKKKKDEAKHELTPSEELAAQLEVETRAFMTLFRSAFSADLRQVEAHIREGAKVDTVLDSGMTPLVAAVQGNHIAVVKLLVHEGKADINKPSLNGTTPLMQACLLGDSIDLVQYFVEERGALIDSTDAAGNTALFYAAKAGNLRAAELLLQRGSLVNHQNKRDMTALMVAVSNCQLPVIDLLHRHDANVEATDIGRHTALHYAAMCGHVKAVKLLSAYSAKTGATNLDGKTPVDLAVDKATADAITGAAGQ